MRTVAFKTLGCRLNQAETMEMAAGFRHAGFVTGSLLSPCDVIVVHGCAVTVKAERDSLRQLRAARRRHPNALIVAVGCIAEKVLRSREPLANVIDLWIGQADKAHVVDRVIHSLGRSPTLPYSVATPDLILDAWRQGSRTRAMLKIQDGCEFRCTYCIVPLLRPDVSSRPIREIVAGARRLAEAGCLEINLTGANLGCYSDNGRRLPDLLRALLDLPGEFRIRLSSIESTTVETDVIELMAESDRLCRYLHLPLQSGDDAVLQRMGRRYGTRAYCDRIAYAQDRLSDFGLGTDLVVGFPGETEAAFETTLSLVETLPFTNLHVFPFSPRPGTVAATWPDTIPPTVKRERVRRLSELGDKKKAAFAARHVGRQVAVLVERLESGIGSGWTDDYLPAQIRGSNLSVNRIVRLPVTGCSGATLRVG